MTIIENLKNIPLNWAKNATYYHQNEHGEYWIASIIDDKLHISGLDIDWTDISLSYDQIIESRDLLNQGVTLLNGWIINKSESLWILSIFEIALYQLKNKQLVGA